MNTQDQTNQQQQEWPIEGDCLVCGGPADKGDRFCTGCLDEYNPLWVLRPITHESLQTYCTDSEAPSVEEILEDITEDELFAGDVYLEVFQGSEQRPIPWDGFEPVKVKWLAGDGDRGFFIRKIPALKMSDGTVLAHIVLFV